MSHISATCQKSARNTNEALKGMQQLFIQCSSSRFQKWQQATLQLTIVSKLRIRLLLDQNSVEAVKRSRQCLGPPHFWSSNPLLGSEDPVQIFLRQFYTLWKVLRPKGLNLDLCVDLLAYRSSRLFALHFVLQNLVCILNLQLILGDLKHRCQRVAQHAICNTQLNKFDWIVLLPCISQAWSAWSHLWCETVAFRGVISLFQMWHNWLALSYGCSFLGLLAWCIKHAQRNWSENGICFFDCIFMHFKQKNAPQNTIVLHTKLNFRVATWEGTSSWGSVAMGS